MSLSEKEIATSHPDLYESLIPLLRHKPQDIKAFLETIDFNVDIPNTSTKAHCHFICLEGSKRPRVNDFAKFIANRITDFAIPRTKVKEALNKSRELGAVWPITNLNAKARNLFTRQPKSGEGGEVLLSVMVESFLGLPQLFTKMVLKTSTEMHVHGSDGIHIGTNNEGHLVFYWGESKLYSDAASAATKCFSSIAPFLLDVGGSGAVQERDLELMRDGIELEDEVLIDALKHYLDPDDPMFNKKEYRAACLIGFDSDAYPTKPNSKEIQEVKNEIEEAFNSRKAHIESRIIQEGIQSFDIHVFCLPFPSVDTFRKAFRAELGFNDE